MKELNEMELKEVDGGFFPLVILGVVVTAKAVAWAVAGCIFVAGLYVGYNEAVEEAEMPQTATPGC